MGRDSTVVDLENSALRRNKPHHLKILDNCTEEVVIANLRPLQTDLDKLIRNPYLKRRNVNPMDYMDILVCDFLGLSQGPTHMKCHVRRNLFHALDKVFQPLDDRNICNKEEVLSLKNIDAWD